MVESLPDIQGGMKEVMCDECYNTFTFIPNYISGDPRNIALMGM